MSTAFPSSAASSEDAADVVVIPTEPPFFQGDETCSTTSQVPDGYQPYCRRLRSCRSCLQKSGCMIDQHGACVNQVASGFSAWMDFQNAIVRDLVLPNATKTNPDSVYDTQCWAFPAFKAQYCPVSDPICKQCIANNFYAPSSQLPDSRFCVGAGGCVCIYDCESDWNRLQVACPYPTSAPSLTGDSSETMNGLNSMVKLLALGMGVLLLLFAAYLFRCIRKDYDRRQRLESEHRLARHARAELRAGQRRERLEKLGVRALTLAGWQTFRQSLIDKEKFRHTGSTEEYDSSHTSTPYVLAIDDEGDAEASRTGSGIDNTMNQAFTPGVTNSDSSSIQ